MLLQVYFESLATINGSLLSRQQFRSLANIRWSPSTRIYSGRRVFDYSQRSGAHSKGQHTSQRWEDAKKERRETKSGRGQKKMKSKSKTSSMSSCLKCCWGAAWLLAAAVFVTLSSIFPRLLLSLFTEKPMASVKMCVQVTLQWNIAGRIFGHQQRMFVTPFRLCITLLAVDEYCTWKFDVCLCGARWY